MSLSSPASASPSTSPFVRFLEKSVAALAGFGMSGAGIGIGAYLEREICRSQGAFGEEAAAALRFKPYIWTGLATQAIVMTVQGCASVALGYLGERSQAGDSNSSLARRWLWKAIEALECVQRKVDSVFSEKLGIRSVAEIERDHIPLEECRFLEIVRNALKQVMWGNVTDKLSWGLGVSAVERLGYRVWQGHLFFWVPGVCFLQGAPALGLLSLMEVIGKVGMVYFGHLQQELLRLSVVRELVKGIGLDANDWMQISDEHGEVEVIRAFAGEANKIYLNERALCSDEGGAIERLAAYRSLGEIFGKVGSLNLSRLLNSAILADLVEAAAEPYKVIGGGIFHPVYAYTRIPVGRGAEYHIEQAVTEKEEAIVRLTITCTLELKADEEGEPLFTFIKRALVIPAEQLKANWENNLSADVMPDLQVRDWISSAYSTEREAQEEVARRVRGSERSPIQVAKKTEAEPTTHPSLSGDEQPSTP